MHDMTKNLLFLLAAAPMAAGCVTSDDVADDETTGDGDGDPTTGDGDGDPTTGDGDGDPTTGDGDGDPTTGDGDGDAGADVQCDEYAMLAAECFGDQYYADALSYCVERVANSSGPACTSALESYYACLSALDCEAITTTAACPTEQAAIDTACDE
jgi:hypothetical protein